MSGSGRELRRLEEFRKGRDVGGIGVYSKPPSSDRLRRRSSSSSDEAFQTKRYKLASRHVPIGMNHQAVLPSDDVVQWSETRGDVLIEDPLAKERIMSEGHRRIEDSDELELKAPWVSLSDISRRIDGKSCLSPVDVMTSHQALRIGVVSRLAVASSSSSRDVERDAGIMNALTHALVFLVRKGDYSSAEHLSSRIVRRLQSWSRGADEPE